MLTKTIRYVEAVPAREAAGVVAEVYRQAKAEMGLLPEAVTMFSADPRLLAATWAPFREALLVTGVVPRATKEAVAATVSQLNDCPYCVDAHTIMLYGSGGASFATALLSGTPDRSQPELAATADWVRAVSTRPAVAPPAPFAVEAVPEMVGTFTEFQFLNRAITVLLDGTFLPGSEKAQSVARKVAGRVVARRIRSTKAPGASVGLPADLPLPADLSWAAPSPHVAAAFGWLAATTDAAAARALPPAARAVVEQSLGGWDGHAPGPSRAWLDERTAELAPADRPAGRLALLTALAPFQSTAGDVAAYRADRSADEDLLGLVAWAAFTAARRIGGWAVPAGRDDAAVSSP